MSKQNYYISRKPKMLSDFDKTANLVRNFIVANYSSDFADKLSLEARQEYEALIPQLPYVEGIRGSMLNSFLRITA